MAKIWPALAVVAVGALLSGEAAYRLIHMGKQPDGSFVVSTGRRIEGDGVAFRGRPSDMAMHPSGKFVAVFSTRHDSGDAAKIFLVGPSGILPDSTVTLPNDPGFRGLIWTPDGKTLVGSLSNGKLQFVHYEDGKLSLASTLELSGRNAVPGGMAITKDGRYLYVACCDLNSVVEVDLVSHDRLRQIPVEQLPFAVKLSEDESKLIVSNWGGRYPAHGDRTDLSEETALVTDEEGLPVSGTISIVDRKTKVAKSFEVGLHPTDIVIQGKRAFVANAMSDTISEFDVDAAKVTRTIPVRWGNLKLIGSMPNALAIQGGKLYACDGGDNAVCQIDLASGKVEGFHHAGYFPIAIQLGENQAYVLNSKGNGSVHNTLLGKPGNAHDFQGTVTMVDLSGDLKRDTEKVARNNGWSSNPIAAKPDLAVYHGAIQHVLYIIKENRTYDEVFGDMPEGNGDPKLCSIGEEIMPNHHALAREFTLFDNAYVSGTNSADGHAWCIQSLANEYLEHFYVGYSRTYPDDSSDVMARSAAGYIWDAALRKHKTFRDYGEATLPSIAEYRPYRPKDWFEAWEDRQSGTHKFQYIANASVPGLTPYLDRNYHYWPLIQSDQARADEFLREYNQFSAADKVPNLMLLSLPSDHTEGMNPDYPLPKSMMADNDLALGRIVEGVSKSPQWKNTCICVIEDDAQAGPDHVDGHRTVFMVISPYTVRHAVDSSFYTTTDLVRSIEMMLGLDPMNQFDGLAHPIGTCFQNMPNLAPYTAVPNKVPLGLRIPPAKSQTESDKFWIAKTAEQDWSHLDAPDPYWLNRVIWYSLKGDVPYPERPGEAPGRDADD